MEKVGRYFLFGVFALIFVSAFVSAAPGPVEALKSFFGGLFELLQPLSNIIFGTSNFSGDLGPQQIFLVKVLFLVITYSVCYLIFKRIPLFENHHVISYIFTAAVSLLATRWVADTEIVYSVLVPYTALGLALSAGIPFAAWFMIVEFSINRPSLRRVAWVFFALLFIVLWAIRFDDLTNKFTSGAGWVMWVYPITAVFALLMAFLDGTFQRFLIKLSAEQAGRDTSDSEIIKLKQQLAELPSLLDSGVITERQAIDRQNRITGKLMTLGAKFNHSI